MFIKTAITSTSKILTSLSIQHCRKEFGISVQKGHYYYCGHYYYNYLLLLLLSLAPIIICLVTDNILTVNIVNFTAISFIHIVLADAFFNPFETDRAPHTETDRMDCYYCNIHSNNNYYYYYY